MSQVIDQTKAKMKAAIDHFMEELRGIRTGRANPGMVEGVPVEIYGSQMRLKELASINAPEARMLVVAPFDPSNKDLIRKAIEKANLGFNPVVDGHIIRIKIPQMDESARKEMIKLTDKRCEETKVRIREARREGNEHTRKQKANGDIGEDEVKRSEKEIQKLTDQFCKDADDLAVKKAKEISAL